MLNAKNAAKTGFFLVSFAIFADPKAASIAPAFKIETNIASDSFLAYEIATFRAIFWLQCVNVSTFEKRTAI